VSSLCVHHKNIRHSHLYINIYIESTLINSVSNFIKSIRNLYPARGQERKDENDGPKMPIVISLRPHRYVKRMIMHSK
jgi:hypothetical protein